MALGNETQQSQTSVDTIVEVPVFYVACVCVFRKSYKKHGAGRGTGGLSDPSSVRKVVDGEVNSKTKGNNEFQHSLDTKPVLELLVLSYINPVRVHNIPAV